MQTYSKAQTSAILLVATVLLGMLYDLKPVRRQLYVTIFRVVQHNHSVQPQVVPFQLQLTCVCDCVVDSSVEIQGQACCQYCLSLCNTSGYESGRLSESIVVIQYC